MNYLSYKLIGTLYGDGKTCNAKGIKGIKVEAGL